MTPFPETHPSLLVRLRDGSDERAWMTFVEIYQPLIYGLLRQRKLQDADAHEIAQEVLLAVSRSIQRWEIAEERGSFRGWLATVTRNLMVNYLIRQSRQPVGSGDSRVWKQIDETPLTVTEHSVLFDLEEKRRIFRWAAEKIRLEVRPDHWTAFWMSAVDGKTAAEVSAETGMSVGLVYVSRNRVMKRLRELIEVNDFLQRDSLPAPTNPH